MVVPLFTVVESVIFIDTVVPVSPNYTMDTIGTIAVMTGWLSNTFADVSLTVQ